LLELFDKYFLILVLIQGFIVGFLDRQNFKEEGNEALARKAGLVGRAMIGLSIVLFVSSRLS
jgi:uncharacterized membrane protein